MHALLECPQIDMIPGCEVILQVMLMPIQKIYIPWTVDGPENFWGGKRSQFCSGRKLCQSVLLVPVAHVYKDWFGRSLYISSLGVMRFLGVVYSITTFFSSSFREFRITQLCTVMRRKKSAHENMWKWIRELSLVGESAQKGKWTVT